MASVNQTRSHCVNQMGKTHSKPLAAWHGRGTAWARHAMCESAFRVARISVVHEGSLNKLSGEPQTNAQTRCTPNLCKRHWRL